MALRKVRSRKFKLKKEAMEWAAKEKKKEAPGETFKWETNRLDGDQTMKWEAVLFKEV